MTKNYKEKYVGFSNMSDKEECFSKVELKYFRRMVLGVSVTREIESLENYGFSYPDIYKLLIKDNFNEFGTYAMLDVIDPISPNKRNWNNIPVYNKSSLFFVGTLTHSQDSYHLSGNFQGIVEILFLTKGMNGSPKKKQTQNKQLSKGAGHYRYSAEYSQSNLKAMEKARDTNGFVVKKKDRFNKMYSKYVAMDWGWMDGRYSKKGRGWKDNTKFRKGWEKS